MPPEGMCAQRRASKGEAFAALRHILGILFERDAWWPKNARRMLTNEFLGFAEHILLFLKCVDFWCSTGTSGFLLLNTTQFLTFLSFDA